jgi:hypothetical protein
MFDWFRKKEPVRPTSWVDTLLALPDENFADVFARMVRNEIPAGRAMVVVAHANMLPMIGVQLETEGGKALDVIEKFVRRIFERLNSVEDDSVASRRLGWSLFSLLLYRLMEKASANPSLKPTVVEIWAMLASSGQHLKPLLEHNVVWSEDEKAWFADIKDANDGVGYVVNLMVPESYRADASFKDLAKKHNFFVL